MYKSRYECEREGERAHDRYRWNPDAYNPYPEWDGDYDSRQHHRAFDDGWRRAEQREEERAAEERADERRAYERARQAQYEREQQEAEYWAQREQEQQEEEAPNAAERP